MYNCLFNKRSQNLYATLNLQSIITKQHGEISAIYLCNFPCIPRDFSLLPLPSMSGGYHMICGSFRNREKFKHKSTMTIECVLISYPHKMDKLINETMTCWEWSVVLQMAVLMSGVDYFSVSLFVPIMLNKQKSDYCFS